VGVLIALDILNAASGGPRLARKRECRLHADDCTEAGEAESDDESFAHFISPSGLSVVW
jgi:hypothetical protein